MCPAHSVKITNTSKILDNDLQIVFKISPVPSPPRSKNSNLILLGVPLKFP